MVIKHYIYHLICPITGLVRYVGKTTNPKGRYKQHLKDTGEATEKKRWLKMLAEKNLVPQMKIIEVCDSEEMGRITEEKHVLQHIETVYNIHNPGKGKKDLKFLKQIN